MPQFIYDAWETSNAKRRIALAEKALAASPLCADAYGLLAQHAQEGSDKALDLAWSCGGHDTTIIVSQAA